MQDTLVERANYQQGRTTSEDSTVANQSFHLHGNLVVKQDSMLKSSVQKATVSQSRTVKMVCYWVCALWPTGDVHGVQAMMYQGLYQAAHAFITEEKSTTKEVPAQGLGYWSRSHHIAINNPLG